MFLQNLDRVLSLINPNDTVLDIGGWAQPFRRADYVLDLYPYETRGWYEKIGMPSHIGACEEHFTKDTWIQRDACSREPFPFPDKFFDYVVCSHFLEDVRDPIWVCSEIVRVGKKGYIEVPSRLSETILDFKSKMVGASHHRWLVTIAGNGIDFTMKHHSLSQSGFHLPTYYVYLMKPEQAVQWLFWEGSFDYWESFGELDSTGQFDTDRKQKDWVIANRLDAPIGQKAVAFLKVYLRTVLPERTVISLRRKLATWPLTKHFLSVE